MTQESFDFPEFGFAASLEDNCQYFNCSELFRINYSSSIEGMWRKALSCFLLSPVIKGTLSLIRSQNNKFPLMQRDKHIHLHSGFLGLALVDLRLIHENNLTQFNFELRQKISDSVLNLEGICCEVKFSSELRVLDTLIANIIDLAVRGKINMGGISVFGEEMRIVSPRTREALNSLSRLKQCPDILQINDIKLVVESSFNIVNLSRDILLTQRHKYFNRGDEAENFGF